MPSTYKDQYFTIDPGNLPPVGTFGPTCFTVRAQIEMVSGYKAAEDIAVSEFVMTLDNGAQPVRAYGSFAAILFETGSIENVRAFIVSPEHRTLIADWRAELLMGCDEVLVTTKHLVKGKDIRIIEGGSVEYIPMLFDAHQIVFADGCASGSCLPDSGLVRKNDAHQTELKALFPELADIENRSMAVRTVAKWTEAASWPRDITLPELERGHGRRTLLDFSALPGTAQLDIRHDAEDRSHDG